MTTDPRLEHLRRVLSTVRDLHQVRLNRNAGTLLSLRGSRSEGLRLSLHEQLLDHPEAIAAIPAWIAGDGRQPEPALQQALEAVQQRMRQLRPPGPDLPTLVGPLDLMATAERVRGMWFPHLSLPTMRWGRGSNGVRRRVRFAAYKRRPPTIIVNPILDQPWVASDFIDFVVFHELCHHAQAMRPIPGETPHSTRFKAWESRFPRYTQVLAWERAHLERFLS